MTNAAIAAGVRKSALMWVPAAALLIAACDVAFDPYEENTIGPFSVFGYLDLEADTQWVRVMPIRQNLLAEPEPIDAVVTLENLVTGRVVTMRDSLFTFNDAALDAVGYAHNFWTTDPLVAGATYRLTATRSDGAATTALVDMPVPEAVVLQYADVGRDLPGVWGPQQIVVYGQHLLYADVVYTVWDRSTDRGGFVTQRWSAPAAGSGPWSVAVPGVGRFGLLEMPPLLDMRRREVSVVVTDSDWPYMPDLAAEHVVIPGVVPTTVENGVGSLVGVATWVIPLPVCTPIDARPDGEPGCVDTFDGSSVSISGDVSNAPCRETSQLPTVRLTERYAGGGAVVREWKTDYDGRYHFGGLRSDSELSLQFVPGAGRVIHIPQLAAGERYAVPDVRLAVDCPPA